MVAHSRDAPLDLGCHLSAPDWKGAPGSAGSPSALSLVEALLTPQSTDAGKLRELAVVPHPELADASRRRWTDVWALEAGTLSAREWVLGLEPARDVSAAAFTEFSGVFVERVELP